MPDLSDDQIDAALDRAYTALVATGNFNGGMVGETWNRWAARAAIAADRALNAPAQPAALLVRDIANDLRVGPLAVCKALETLGYGPHSVNMAVTADMTRELTRHFAPAQAQAEPVAYIVRSVDRPQGLGTLIRASEAGSYQRAALTRQPLYAAPQSASEPASALPPILFDGFAVLQALTSRQRARTSAENVGDVLDALVKIMRAERAAKDKP